MDRKQYNQCMVPFMKGSKTKEQRKLDFCVGAKICSGKAQTKEQAGELCSNTDAKATRQASAPENNPCASITEMATWVQQPSSDGVCRPCLLPPVTQWYMDVLNMGGMTQLAAELEGAVDGGEVALATKLDEVKEKVSPEIRARLREFDCHAQLYKGGENGN